MSVKPDKQSSPMRQYGGSGENKLSK